MICLIEQAQPLFITKHPIMLMKFGFQTKPLCSCSSPEICELVKFCQSKSKYSFNVSKGINVKYSCNNLEGKVVFQINPVACQDVMFLLHLNNRQKYGPHQVQRGFADRNCKEINECPHFLSFSLSPEFVVREERGALVYRRRGVT